jgi:hypothetical protein
MLIIKVNGNLQYNIGKLQGGIRVSENIPRFVITAEGDVGEEEKEE